MATMNISIPDQMKEYVEGRVTKGGYTTTSEYFRDLIREDQKNQAQEELEAMLLEGLASEKKEMTAEDWEALKQRVRDRHKEKQAT